MQQIRPILKELKRQGLISHFANTQKGIEREGLRVLEDGHIADTPHPTALGSALTNSFITTDYSEALLEFITPVFNDNRELLSFLQDLHSFSLQNMNADEIFWHFSMPCIISAESEIPIAEYGTSNIGKMKNIYRRGLGHRYGRHMQTIAGIHYNFSFSADFWRDFASFEKRDFNQDYISERYMDLIRNFQRYSWVLVYFFGASPTLCQSFLKNTPGHNLDALSHHSFGRVNGTSLRLSDLGYTNDSQEELCITTNNLPDYIKGLKAATEIPSPQYAEIGIKNDDSYQQLNANVLQIENEYYSTVRPKQPVKPLEKPTTALRDRGIEYVEIRALDVNPFAPAGMSYEQSCFLEVFLTACLLMESPEIDGEEMAIIQRNDLAMIHKGLESGLCLEKPSSGEKVCRKKYLNELFAELEPIAEAFDDANDTKDFSAALTSLEAQINNPRLTPAGKIIDSTHAKNTSFYQFAKERSKINNDLLLQKKISTERHEILLAEAKKSLAKQVEYEASDTLDFDKFLNNYFKQK